MTTHEVPVVLSLGANLGDPVSTLRAALAELNAHRSMTIRAVSGWYRTAPVGVLEQPDFINVVACGTTGLDPDQLWGLVSSVEQAHGRQRLIPGGPRTLDIDVISLGHQIRATTHLTLPHPRAHQRPFVLVPWSAIDPTAELPGHGAVADLVASMDTSGVTLLELSEGLP